jgi:uncharacterized SAM-binding protein YcdF (DUF218 family)
MLKSKLPFFSLKIIALILLPVAIGLVYLYTQEIELIVQTPREAWEQDLTADCAVVLTGGPGRVKEGLDMLIRKQVQRLIIAGVNPQVTLRDLYPQLVLYPQINEEEIVLERYSETTYGNAQQSLPIVEALQCREILLVTSYLHMRRAHQTFLATFPEEIKVIPYGIAGSDFPAHFWDLFIEATKSWFYSLWAY